MADVRPFDPALFAEAAIDAETARLNSDMIQLLTGQPEGGSSAPRPCGPHAARRRAVPGASNVEPRANRAHYW